MPVSVRLAIADALCYPQRILGAVLALLAASCLVVWVVSAYDKLVSEFEGTAREALGHYDLFVVPDSLDEKEVISDRLIEALRKDPRIADVHCSLRKTVTMGRSFGQGEGPRGGSPNDLRRSGRGQSVVRGGENQRSPGGSQPTRPMFLMPTLVGIDAPVAPYPVVAGQWLDVKKQPVVQAVISEQLAESFRWDVGQTIRLNSGGKDLSVQIVGIVQQPESVPTLEKEGPTGRPVGSTIGPFLGMPPGAIYVPLDVAQEFLGMPGAINLLGLKLTSATRLDQFLAEWTSRVSPFVDGGSYLLMGERQLEKAFTTARASRSIRSQAWTACGLAIMAAVFLIFATLNMGVDERSRQIGLCRVVGLTQAQVAGTILTQALLLAIAGWVGGLGAAGIVFQLGRGFGLNLTWSGTIGPYSLGLSAAVTFLGAGVAAVWPMLRASRVSPLEALQARHTQLLRDARPSTLGWLAFLGSLLIVIHPLVVYILPLDEVIRVSIATTVGAPLMVLGFVCWTPALVVIAEKAFSIPLGMVLGIPRQLCKMELTRNLPRSVGICMAVSVGLGVFTAMMVWGYSMLEPFKPTTWAPDLLAAFQLGHVPESELESISTIPGISKLLPVAVEQPRLAEDLTGASRGASVVRQDNVIIMGVNPDLAFGGKKPVFAVDFVQGSRDTAVQQLKSNRGCIVPDHFLKATGLRLGDTFSVCLPDQPEQTVEYRIAGVVSLPGWHWMTKFSGLRRRFGRSAALVFADENVVRKDFKLVGINFLWIDLEDDANLDLVCRKLQEVADRHLGPGQPVNFQGTWAFGARMFGRSLRVTLRDEIRQQINRRADTMIWGMAQLPFVTLLITLPGLMTVVNASVRTRQWEFGVMRAIGFPSTLIARQVLVEGFLIAAVASMISLLFGIAAGWCGIGLAQYTSFFGGMETPLIIPWQKLMLGIGATFLVCGVAAVPAALAVFRREPLQLLTAGRGEPFAL